MDALNDLKQFYEKIIEYEKLIQKWGGSLFHSDKLKEDIQSLITELQRGYSRLESTIMQYGGTDFKQNVFYTAFDSFSASSATARLNALTKVIPIVNEAIGKLETTPLAELEARAPKGTKVSSSLFDKIQFHPKVIEASRSCFVAGNYREAILNAFISFIDYIKEMTELDLDGDDLMNKVFSFNYDKDLRKITKYPIIRINELKNSNDRNEQQGFMFLCKGAAGGIRNPKAHKLITQSNPLHTLEYLAFASLLIRRVEEGKVVKPKPPRERWNLEKFLIDAEKRCMPEKVEIMKKLIDFTASNSDAGILWGTGAKYGSFVFQKLVNNKATSIFQIYTDGTLFLYFQPLKNKGVSIALLNQFRLNVNKIPGVNITENVVNEKDKYGSLSLNIFINPSNLNIFKEAVSSLCKDLENYKEASS